jgi:hypothetical protein
MREVALSHDEFETVFEPMNHVTFEILRGLGRLQLLIPKTL